MVEVRSSIFAMVLSQLTQKKIQIQCLPGSLPSARCLTPTPTTSFAAPAVAHAAPSLAAGRISPQPSARAAPAHGSERSSPAAAREWLLRAPLGGSPTAAHARSFCPRCLAELSRSAWPSTRTARPNGQQGQTKKQDFVATVSSPAVQIPFSLA